VQQIGFGVEGVMTVKAELECDARGCSNTIEIDLIFNSVESEVDVKKWHTDPESNEYHYCPSCWPKVKNEFKT